MRVVSKILLILNLVLMSLSVRAQLPVSRNYTVDDGLPSNETYALFEDRKGYIWIATDRGVSRFDGYTFQNFTTDDGLPDNTIFNFQEDSQGRIWFRTFNGKLGYFDVQNNYFKTIDKLVFQDFLINFNIDSTDLFSMHTSKGFYAFRFDENGDTISVPVGGRFYPKAFNFRKMDLSEVHEIYAGMYNGIYGSQAYVRKDNRIFISIGGFHYIYNDRFDLLFSTNVSITCSYMEVEDSMLRFYCQDGIVEKRNFSDLKLLGRDSIDRVVTWKITDRQGNRWESTLDKGIYFISNPKTLVYNKEKIIDVLGSEKDDILYSDFDGYLYANHKRKKGLQYVRVKEFYETNGDLYFSNKEVYKNYQNINLEHIYFAQAFCVEQDEFWAANINYLTKGTIVENQWHLDTAYRVPRYRMERMRRAGNKIWIGSINGLILFDIPSGKFTYFEDDSLLSNRITDLEIAGQDTNLLFMGTRGKGLLIKKNNQIWQISTGQGLLSNLTNAIFNQGDSVIWIGTNNGLSKVTIRNLEPLDYSVRNYTMANGLSSNNINDVHILNDSVYVATKKGVNCFHINDYKKDVAPPVYITGIQINRSDTTILENYILKAGQNTINLNFLGLSYADARNTKYKYRLIGADTNWYYQQATAIQFLSLAPNTYTFEVVAVNHNGVESSKPAQISFTILTPLLLRWYFITGYILAFTLTVFSLIRYRMKVIRKNEMTKRKLVEMELKALRSQMNPHFTFNTLNSIQSFINKQSPELAVDYIAKFAELMRLILENSAEEFIDLGKELKALDRYLEIESLRFEEKFEYEIIVDDEIDIYYEKIPSMVLQPYIENAIWHGLLNKPGKGRIRVQVEQLEHGIKCIVDDNGVGREKAMEIKQKNGSQRKSFGMLITGERLEILNNFRNRAMTVVVIDKKDELGNAIGTRVELNILDK